MGSAASTPNHSENHLEDPWWPIENTNFNLSQPNFGSVMDPSRSTSESNSAGAEILKEQISDTITPLVQSASESHTCESEAPVEVISTKREQSLDEFKEELRVKRMARQGAIADLRNEITNLRQQLESEREVNRKLRNGQSTTTDVNDAATLTDPVSSIQSISDLVEKDPTISSSTSLRSQLAEVQLSLQLVNAENLSLSTELGVVRKQVASLKEVIVCSKEMLNVREEQVTQLKDKLREIEDSLAERELKIMSDNLRQEYDRQLTNIRNLRQLYEERARVSAAERENLLRQISIKKDELATETEKTKNLEERVLSLEEELTVSNKNLTSAKIQRDEYNYENKGLKEEMAVINKLFSQMLMGFNGANNLDIDRLTTMLEENRTLLNEMATTEGNSEGACLPKLLFEIVKEANTENEIPEGVEDEDEAAEEHSHVASAQEIIGNLPKVWRVLMELLNHQKIEQVEFQENGQSEDCYKSIQTPTGPKVELSVSKTYIKLKDLILEKKSLQKETTKLKTLNGHLDRRLHEQEKRLSTVSLELTKTWHLVGKMQRQHRQLHTHEQILRYQLQQKRRLLNELKDELEYCRRKWAAARAKNDESQIQCDDLRKEFAKRKLQDANNSAESGYSDGPVSDEDEVVISKKDHNEIFEKSRKIERTHSQSPTRSTIHGLVKRVNSAPHIAALLTEFVQATNDISNGIPLQNVAASSVVLEDVMAVATVAVPPKEVASITVVNNPGPSTTGTVPKQGVRLSRAKRQDRHQDRSEAAESLEDMFLRLSGQQSEKDSILQDNAEEKRVDRAARIQRLEQQCKSLITQVIETSSCREELNEQLVRFQEELVPTNKVVENTDVESDVKPTEACLTAREEEYTTRRAERLKRLEDESNALMTRIKKTTDRGKNMTSLLDHIHSRCVNSREGSFDESESGRNSPGPSCDDSVEAASNVEQAVPKLTETEEAYTARRSERIKRLEEESALLLGKVSRNAERGTSMSTKLDELHSKYGPGTSKNLTNNEDKDPSDQPLELCSGSDSEEKTIPQQDHQDQSSQIEDGASNQTLENSLTESAKNLDNASLDCESSTEAESGRQLQNDSDSNEAHPQ